MKFIIVILLSFFLVPSLVHASEITAPFIFERTNAERIASGQQGLKTNARLMLAARLKAEDMVKRQYFAHYNRQGQGIGYFLRRANVSYSTAGENLALGFNTSEGTVRAWMGSKNHKANLLDPSYKETGIAVVKINLNGKDQILIVQMFLEPNYDLSR